MKFTVVWLPAAESQLAQIWLSARDRLGISEATERIDSLLRTNPEQQGESRADDRRVLLETPLGVVFRVLPDDLRVQVLRIWRYRT